MIKRTYFIEEMKQNELASKKQEKVYKILIHTKNSLIWASSVFISPFTSLVCIPVGIARSRATINIWVVTAGIKKYESINQFVSIDNVLKEYKEMKEEIKNFDNIKWIFIVLNV